MNGVSHILCAHVYCKIRLQFLLLDVSHEGKRFQPRSNSPPGTWVITGAWPMEGTAFVQPQCKVPDKSGLVLNDWGTLIVKYEHDPPTQNTFLNSPLLRFQPTMPSSPAPFHPFPNVLSSASNPQFPHLLPILIPSPNFLSKQHKWRPTSIRPLLEPHIPIKGQARVLLNTRSSRRQHRTTKCVLCRPL